MSGGQVRTHWLFTQSGAAQVSFVHATQLAGGAPQSFAVSQLLAPQWAKPAWHLPRSLQELITPTAQSSFGPHDVQ